MSTPRATRARLFAWSLGVTALALATLTVASVWGNLWIAWSDVAVGAFHGQLYIRWGFSNPVFQILSPGVHARWFDAEWDWYHTWHVRQTAFRSVDIPLLIPLAAVSAAAAWFISYARALRSAGRCPKCGYDLAGLGLATVCPECGRSVARHR